MGVDRSDYIMYGWKLPYNIKDNNGNKIDLFGVTNGTLKKEFQKMGLNSFRCRKQRSQELLLRVSPLEPIDCSIGQVRES